MIEFDINNYISVKLTDAGKAELERQHNELRKTFPSTGEYKSRTEDEEGWTRFQGWVLMYKFGHMMSMTGKPPFETTIKLEVQNETL